MNLKECEQQLKDVTEQINMLVREREEVLLKWQQAFDAESSQEVTCICEKTDSGYAIVLISGESKQIVSEVWDMDFQGDSESYYKQVEHGIWKHKALNKRQDDLPDWQRNLIFAKAAELRKNIVG